MLVPLWIDSSVVQNILTCVCLISQASAGQHQLVRWGMPATQCKEWLMPLGKLMILNVEMSVCVALISFGAGRRLLYGLGKEAI